MISGGTTDGDSNWAWKDNGCRLENLGISTGRREEPTISFGPEDLQGIETPHDDALVIQATIANYKVSRIFVKTRSSINVLFREAFNQMQIDLNELRPMNTALFGFVGHEVQPLGQVNQPISIGEEPARWTRTVIFIVVGASSSYNVILGRHALSSFQAIVSTYH